eukprot:CAMPEP_0206427674 /NCGR_PEP_ID=MMETSP0324_2-20121206/5183_1 /ASSEMBLY_ACC=CAM_ASM_000836 /TAXON_ID=2866 /ORGANISM="Crypthecodinium cohnii, Strain Seligo" /LENGTH=56 /DNA_ID=CAMNT_0053893003 /DNA_START=492 /DNA_END=662 /DNA_ORIENTATION=-
MRRMPESSAKVPTCLPGMLRGMESPKPTVMSVTMHHHIEETMLKSKGSSFSSQQRP